MTFATDADTRSEQRVQAAVAAAWGCEVVSFGPLNPVDGYMTRSGSILGFYEIKCRTNPSTQYPTVFLAVRKWLDLTRLALAADRKAIFLVGWEDGIGWVDVQNIDARAMKIGGRVRDYRAKNDQEPVIEVPVSEFKMIDYQ